MSARRSSFAQSAALFLIEAYRHHLPPARATAARGAWPLLGRWPARIPPRRFLAALQLLRPQFDRCAMAHQGAAEGTPGAYRRLVPAGQRGDCDCGAFDLTPGSGCDLTDVLRFCDCSRCD